MEKPIIDYIWLNQPFFSLIYPFIFSRIARYVLSNKVVAKQEIRLIYLRIKFKTVSDNIDFIL